jgi:hypothetical protein
MRDERTCAVAVVALLAFASSAHAQGPVGTAFTYQGRLEDAGLPANGAYDLQLALFDAATGGALAGPLLTREDVSVSSGLFTVALDFGTTFAGNARWLELRVRPGSSTGAFTTLGPRQPLTPSPYAVFSTGAPWTGVAGKPAGFADDVDNDALGGLACGPNQVARWNGSAWACAGDNAHDHLGQTWSGSPLGLRVESSTADGLVGVTTAVGGNGVQGSASAAGARGLFGVSSATTGGGSGVLGQSDSSSGRGVFGVANATSGPTSGVRGQVSSSQGVAVVGLSLSTDGQAHGVRGTSQSPNGRGVGGEASATGGQTIGVLGESHSTGGRGVVARATSLVGFTIGLDAEINTPAGAAVNGISFSTTGTAEGVHGETSASAGTGVRGHSSGTSSSSSGVYGSAVGNGVGVRATSVAGPAVHGITSSPTGIGVRGEASSDDSAVGVFGLRPGTAGVGVVGNATGSGIGIGVIGSSSGPMGVGVSGRAVATTGSTVGVYGTTSSSQGFGVVGQATASGGVSIFGSHFFVGGTAGLFEGNVSVLGTLSKSAGSFRIDHPLDPENKYLSHSFVESPDMMNVYNGNVVLDADGEAEIALPDWFEALNQDFRYQLTAIGRPGPGLHVAAKVKDNRFRIGGGSPGMEVSWQVTGIRHDAYAEKHRIPVEEDKPPADRGRYLQPEAYGLSRERAVSIARPRPAIPLVTEKAATVP